MSARSMLRGVLTAAAAGTLVFSGAAAVTASAAPGNNGTLKIHEYGTPSGTESNDPKVCKFNVEGFGFDSGQTGYLKFETQGGDKPTGQNAGPFTWGPANSSGRYDTQYFNLKDGHYKAVLYGKQSPKGELTDVKAKSKVFKVQCDQEEPPAPPASCPEGTRNLASFAWNGSKYVLKTGGNVVVTGNQQGGSFDAADGLTVSAIVVAGADKDVVNSVRPPANTGSFTNGGIGGSNIKSVTFCGGGTVTETDGEATATIGKDCEVLDGEATGDTIVQYTLDNTKRKKATEFTLVTAIDGKVSASTKTVAAKDSFTDSVAYSAENGKMVGIEIRVGDKVLASIEFKTSECKKSVPETPDFIVNVSANKGSCTVRVPVATVTTSGEASIGYKLAGSSKVNWQHPEVAAGTYKVTLPKVAAGSSVSYRVVVSPLDDSMKPFVSKKFTFSVPADCDKPTKPEKPENPTTPEHPQKPVTPEKPGHPVAPPPSEDEGGTAAASSSPFLPIGAVVALALIGYGISRRRQHT